MNAGLYPNLPESQYHADPSDTPSLSASIAHILLSQSPRHAFEAHPKLNPNWEPSEASSEMDFGSAIHALTLEDDPSKIVVIEHSDYRTNDAKDKREAARKSGRIPLLAHKFKSAMQMTAAIRAQIMDTELADLFAPGGGDSEITAVWEEANGITCRARLDKLKKDRRVIGDLKCTDGSANPEAWSRFQLISMGNAFQGGFYHRGINKLCGTDPTVVFIVCEMTAPYLVSLVGLTPHWLDLARRLGDIAVAKWGECLKSQQWEAYPKRICYPTPPAWWEEQILTRELAAVSG